MFQQQGMGGSKSKEASPPTLPSQPAPSSQKYVQSSGNYSFKTKTSSAGYNVSFKYQPKTASAPPTTTITHGQDPCGSFKIVSSSTDLKISYKSAPTGSSNLTYKSAPTKSANTSNLNYKSAPTSSLSSTTLKGTAASNLTYKFTPTSSTTPKSSTTASNLTYKYASTTSSTSPTKSNLTYKSASTSSSYLCSTTQKSTTTASNLNYKSAPTSFTTLKSSTTASNLNYKSAPTSSTTLKSTTTASNLTYKSAPTSSLRLSSTGSKNATTSNLTYNSGSTPSSKSTTKSSLTFKSAPTSSSHLSSTTQKSTTSNLTYKSDSTSSTTPKSSTASNLTYKSAPKISSYLSSTTPKNTTTSNLTYKSAPTNSYLPSTAPKITTTSTVSHKSTPTSSLYVPSTNQKSTTTSSQKSASNQVNTNSNTKVTVDSVITANISVAHPVNDYKIPNVEIDNDNRPSFDLHLKKRFIRRNNLKIERFVMRVCPQYLSKKGCCIQYCYRFHVCQFWIKGNCTWERCKYDHGFDSENNRILFDVIQSRNFDEHKLADVLKQNMFRGEELVRERDLTICIEFILNRCKINNCKFHHVKNEFMWQISINNNWVNFPESLNDKVETLFTVPSNTKWSVSFQKIFSRGGPKINPIFLSNSLEVDCDKMTITWKGSNYKIRRLSTESDVKKSVGLATRWLWYWEDDSGCWNFYNNAILKDSGMVVIAFSDYLETEYLKNEKVVFFKYSDELMYDVNFSTMMQTNQITSKRRRIRRRPMPTTKKSSWNENTTIRSLWSITNDSSEKFIRTVVAPQSPEYLYFKRMVEKSLSVQNFTLERIENIYLWKTYQIKKAQMLASHTNNTTSLNEQYLFHGTSKSAIDKICEQNLDWRLYGTNVGNAFGKGIYFSSSAAVSNSYAASDENGFKWMLIILVLVGKACVGDSTFVIPPVNPSTKTRFDSTVECAINPYIFVKYNLDDYYPAYIVKYS
ncbi:Poly [ADP-ribose] polymerase 12 [Armadillidium vulgare]|nr:Poly [ADP-ribose] polymerase 12 [Armadillidium vulgare]